MAKSSATVSTTFGTAKISLVVCDACGTEIAHDDGYTPALGWFRLSECVEGKTGFSSRRDNDFCSVDCVVGTLVPDIYDSNPAAVLKAVSNLKRIEKSLGARPEEAS